jgi:hypothetical protein
MQLGDNLGFAGLIFGVAGVGITILWPTKRPIGYVCIAVAVLIAVCWGIISLRKEKPAYPLKVDVKVGDLIVGKPLSVFVVIRNVSGKTIPIRFSNAYSPVIPTADLYDNVNLLEDKFWAKLLSAPWWEDGELTTANDGIRNREIQSAPLSQTDVENIRNGLATIYYAAYIEDRSSGERIVEVCGHVKPPAIFTSCLKHNKP